MGRYKKKPTKLLGHELAISLDDRRQAFWLHQKFTSLTFMRRMAALYKNFVEGYEGFVKLNPAQDYQENLLSFLTYRAKLESGLALVEKGHKSGYEDIFAGCYFFEYLSGRRFEFGFENKPIGWRYDWNHVGLYAWADVAIKMARKTKWAVSAEWAFPAILAENAVGLPPAEQLPAVHVPYGPAVPTGDEIPISGIWEPAAPGHCPAYFGAGWPAPEACRAMVKYEGLDPNEDGTESFVTLFEYGTQPTQWRLLWEDKRYEGRADPDEGAYLDPTTEPPPWPAEYVPTPN